MSRFHPAFGAIQIGPPILVPDPRSAGGLTGTLGTRAAQAAIPAAPVVPGLPGGPARFDDQGRPLGGAVQPAPIRNAGAIAIQPGAPLPGVPAPPPLIPIRLPRRPTPGQPPVDAQGRPLDVIVLTNTPPLRPIQLPTRAREALEGVAEKAAGAVASRILKDVLTFAVLTSPAWIAILLYPRRTSA